MKTAITTLQQPTTPPKPQRGDIAACEQYANYHAAKSQQPKATLAHIWTRFIAWSYLDDSEVKS